MKNTIIYLIRHADTLDENGIRNTNENEQLIDREFKTSDGESCKDTNKRMNDFLEEILNNYKEKKIVLVSHGGAIKFLLLNWCEVNENVKLVYKNEILDITSPFLLKMIFNKNKLIKLEQIKY